MHSIFWLRPGVMHQPAFVHYDKPPIMKRKQKFEMLGTVLNEKGNCDDAVASQLAKAQGTFWSMAYIFKNRCIPREVRFKKYIQLVVSVALHGAGSWVWTTKIANQLQTFENKCLRIICNFTRETFNDELDNWVVWIRRTSKMATSLHDCRPPFNH